MKILVLNCGSSSLKYQLIDMENENVIAKGYFERIGSYDSFVTHKVNGEKYRYDVIARDHGEAIKFVLKQFTDERYPVIKSLDEIAAIGHRIVHGGEKFQKSCIITEEVKKEIEDAVRFAPLHNPAHLQGIKACEVNLPGKPNVAVFDTAFHQTLKKEQYLYPIPYEYYEKYGIRKYGFHGTSHKYVSLEIAKLLGMKTNRRTKNNKLPYRSRRKPMCHSKRSQRRHNNGAYTIRRSCNGFTFWRLRPISGNILNV